MRKYILSSIILLFFFFNLNTYSQSSWNSPKKLTGGYIDRNPVFKSISNPVYMSNIYSDYEFFAFTRYIQTYSQICLGKISSNGLMDSILYLTSGNFLRQNPCISYGNRYSFMLINSALVLWETNENGKWDIYGKYYNKQTGWGNQFAVDNSNVNKSTPQCVCIDSNSYAITYARSGDIIFKIFNPITQTVTYDTNLTVTDTAFCYNPHICINNNYPSPGYLVTYEKKKADSKRAIYYRKNSNLSSWSVADTVAYLGDNYFNSFCAITSSSGFGVAFTSDRTGYKNVYYTTIPFTSGSLQQEKIIINPGFNFYNFTSMYYPIITDYFGIHACAMLKRLNDSVKVLLDNIDYSSFRKDSTTICDTSKSTSITLSSGFFVGSDIWVWVLYNKDSANVSQIWGRKKLILLGDVKKIGNIVPEKYSLEQNYPNPFNPATEIKFQIKDSRLVTLKVFDILGKEVETLVNEKLSPGEYEVTFDGGILSSGIYFYSLFADGKLIDTKKMIILK